MTEWLRSMILVYLETLQKEYSYRVGRDKIKTYKVMFRPHLRRTLPRAMEWWDTIGFQRASVTVSALDNMHGNMGEFKYVFNRLCHSTCPSDSWWTSGSWEAERDCVEPGNRTEREIVVKSVTEVKGPIRRCPNPSVWVQLSVWYAWTNSWRRYDKRGRGWDEIA